MRRFPRLALAGVSVDVGISNEGSERGVATCGVRIGGGCSTTVGSVWSAEIIGSPEEGITNGGSGPGDEVGGVINVGAAYTRTSCMII